MRSTKRRMDGVQSPLRRTVDVCPRSLSETHPENHQRKGMGREEGTWWDGRREEKGIVNPSQLSEL